MSEQPARADASGAASSGRGALPAIELPTLALILADYGGWLTVTYAYGQWPLWVVAPVVAVLLTLHSSLQHEILHGHPTRWRAVNDVLGIVPLSLWLPYERYRMNHLVHHIDERLTDPVDDPESYYWTPEAWQGVSAFRRRMTELQQTLAGRVLCGPFWRIPLFLRGEVRAFARNEPGLRAIWIRHLAWCVPVVLWITVVCGIPLWLYLIAMVIPGNGILLIRSFAEHRARPGVRERVAIVEGSWILGPLFLFNNLHALHHEEPAIPWYRYNARYRVHRERLIAANGGLVYSTYFDVARRFLLRPHDNTVHPTGRVPQQTRGAEAT
jgi:fatty acid desaturase